LILYVETNFVLELAYLRDTSENCRALIDLAREGSLTLVVPSFALIEARMAWYGGVKRRNKLHDEVRIELAEMSRSRPLADIREQSKAFIAALVDTASHDRSRLEAAVATLLECSSVEPTTPEVVAQTFALANEIALSSQDATIYATILHHLRTAGDEPKVFATQNTSDFLSPTIEEELARHNCKLFGSFRNAEGYIRSILAAS
jgi:predicted nucleic acid-binding protein